MSWTRSLHFKAWADTQEARSLMPLLLRKLVRSVVPPDSVVLFPAAEQVQRPGFDGQVETREGNQFVPAGKSVWETGVSTDIKSKADEDFEKRTAITDKSVQRESTFVFATPREWRQKDQWAEEKRASGEWKDVRAIDANDLEHWIEQCPAVDVWFSTTTGRRPLGTVDLAARWSALSSIAQYKLTPQLFLASRADCIASLRAWTERDPSSLLLTCDAPDSAVDFLTAYVAANSAQGDELNRFVLVDDIGAWRVLASNREPLILVASISLELSAEDIAGAIDHRHHALICGGRSAAHIATTLELPRQDAWEITKELRECGFDDATSRRIGTGCCGSSSILKRLLTKHPDSQFPDWSDQPHRVSLAPFALLGGWVHAIEAPGANGRSERPELLDVECIEALLEISSETLESVVTTWTCTHEPLFLRFRNHVVVASREDAWFLLGAAVTPQLLKRFEDLARLVIEEDDPALDLDTGHRWLAPILGKLQSLSSELRRGIVESLALMAAYPTADRPALTVDFQGTVRRVLQHALPPNASWKRWASLDRLLCLFAESDPEFLLTRIEEDIVSASPQIPRLFENGGTGFFSSSLHCGLIWALETMAWSPELLIPATKCLALLAQVENALPENMANRPSNSLAGIYMWWHCCTNATVDQRIYGLQTLVNEHPAVGWDLLLRLLPSGVSTTARTTEMPRWRHWAVGWTWQRVRREEVEYAFRIANVVMETAGDSPTKWAQALDGILRYGNDILEHALAKLRGIASDSHGGEDRSTLWKSMHHLISRHRSYPEANWAFNSSLLQQLSEICDQLTPEDPVVLHEWLFDHHPDLPNTGQPRDWRRYHLELESRQKAALVHIIDVAGLPGLLRLTNNVRNASSIGWLVGFNQYLGADAIDLWSLVNSTEHAILKFVSTYAAGSFSSQGVSFLEKVNVAAQLPASSAELLRFLPFERVVWDFIDSSLCQAAAEEYWQKCRGIVREGDANDAAFAVRRLLNARRPFTAADVLQMSLQSHGSCEVNLAFQVLESGVSAEHNKETVDQFDHYATQELIKYLQDEGGDLKRLAQVEWSYLAVLAKESSLVEPKTLFDELHRNPSFFVDAIKLGFPGSSDVQQEQSASASNSTLVEHARTLLDAFSLVPGASEDGQVDETILKTWANDVRAIAEQQHRVGVTDRQLGILLSRVPRKGGNEWPPAAVCGLIEQLGTKELFEGFFHGIVSERGVTSRAHGAGGALERELVASYLATAKNLQNSHPKFARTFERLAAYFERYAQMEDEDAERERLER